MKIFIIAAVAIALGVVLGWALCVHAIRKKRRSRSEQESEKKQAETMKRVIWVCLVNGFAWVWCSYILAYLDRVQIAESLSQIAVTEIIGVVLAYSIKSAVENLSKHNRWPDKEAANESEPPNAG